MANHLEAPPPPDWELSSVSSESSTQSIRTIKHLSQRKRLRYKNLKANIPHDETPQLPKPEGTTRFYWQNTNGFPLIDENGGTFHTANEHLNTLQVDGAGFSEINVDTTKGKVTSKLYNAVRKTSSHCQMQSASSRVVGKIHKLLRCESLF